MVCLNRQMQNSKINIKQTKIKVKSGKQEQIVRISSILASFRSIQQALQLYCMFFFLIQPLLRIRFQIQGLRSQRRNSIYKLVSLIEMGVWISIMVSIFLTGKANSLFILKNQELKNHMVFIYVVLSSMVKLGILSSFLFRNLNGLLRTIFYLMLSINQNTLLVIDTLMAFSIFFQTIRICLKIAALINVCLSIIIRLMCELWKASNCMTNTDPSKHLPSYPNLALKILLRTIFLSIISLPDFPGNEIIQTMTCILSVLHQCSYLSKLPYITQQAIIINIALFSLVQSIMLIHVFGELAPIIEKNLHYLYSIAVLFSFQCGVNFYSNKKQKLLSMKLDSIDQTYDAINRMHHFRENCFVTNAEKMSFVNLVINDHKLACTKIDCVCHSEDKFLINVLASDSKQVITGTNTTPGKNMFVRHFLLTQCQFIQQYFSGRLNVWLLYLSALADVGFYTRLMYQCAYFEKRFCHQLTFQSKFESSYLRRSCCEMMQTTIASPIYLNIELSKEYEAMYQQLKDCISKIVSNKVELWTYVSKGYIMFEDLQKYLDKEQNLVNQIQSIYERAKLNNLKSRHFIALLIHYANQIIQNKQFSRQISKSFFLDNIKDNQNIIFKITHSNFVDISSSFGAQNCSVLKVSMSRDTLGQILWYSRNLLQMFRYDNTVSLIGKNLNVLVPKPFRQQHLKVMQIWYQSPNPSILNRFRDLLAQTNDGAIYEVKIYNRIVAMDQSFEMYCLITRIDSAQHVLLDSNLDILNHPKCLVQIIRKANLKENIILNLALLSTLELSDFAQNRQVQVQLRICQEYPRLYLDYIDAIKGYSVDVLGSVRSGLILYYQTLIQQSPELFTIVLQGKVHSFNYLQKLYKSLKITHKVQKARRTSSVNFALNLPQIQTVKNQFSIHSTASFLSNNEEDEFSQIKTYKQNEISSQSSAMHQAQISENKIKFFEHYLLKRMNIGLICCLAFMITIFGLRVNLSSTFLTNYTNVLNADSSVSDLMQLCQVTYDYALLLHETALGKIDIDSDYLKVLTRDIVDMLLQLTQRDGLTQGQVTEKSVLQSVNYLEKKTPMDILNQKIVISNALFFREWFQAIMNVVDQYDKCQNYEATSIMKQNLLFLVRNYPQIVALNHDLIVLYQQKGQANMDIFRIINWILTPIFFLVSILFVYQIRAFKVNDRKKLNQLLSFFGTISSQQVNVYIKYYKYAVSNLVSIKHQKDLNLNSNRKTICTSKATSKKYLKYLILFIVIFLWELLCCLQTEDYIPRAIAEITQMNNIMDSENYLIQNMIFVNELRYGLRTPEASYQKKVQTQLYSPEVEFALRTKQLIQSRQPEYRPKFISVITADICQSPRDRLTVLQYNKCKDILKQLSSSGIISTMSYTQRVILKRLKTVSHPQSDAFNHNLDLMIYNQFRIYQLIQDQIILQNIHIGNELVNSLVVIYAINGIVLALIIIGIVYMNIYENQQKVRHFKYLLTIPPAELGNNRYLRKFILKYC